MSETIDRYEVLQKLASGGMAELFLAKQSGMEGFEKVVVIKRILPHLASDQEFVSMFLDEARIAAKLSHPNVVQIYDLGRADDTYYIAMEYVSGRNVSAVIKKARDRSGLIPVEHVARVVAGVCDGLFYAHTRKDYDGKALNIIHRDISPQNILVSFAGGVKLVDFGIAKASTQLAQTRAGVLKGKYSYMSPEQVKGDKIDGRSDIFAVGICMYEMLTGQRPFERDNSLKTLKAIVQEKPLNPRDLNPSVPPEIVKILSKSLEKDPNRRYANAQEMQLALEDWLDRSPNKSNNVRISRYLYDLFDDELNAEGGTLEVKGIGEVIIPTGTNKGPAVDDAASGVEEVPEGTLRAALAEVEAAHHAKQAAKQAGAAPAAAAPPARGAPQASPPPEDDEDVVNHGDEDATAIKMPDDPPPGRSPQVATRPVAAHASMEDEGEPEEGTDPSLAQPEIEGGASEELDGATVPVFDLQAYEAERERRHGGGAPGAGAPGGDTNADASDFEDGGATLNMDAAQRASLLAAAAPVRAEVKPPPTRVRTETVDPPRRTSGPLEPIRASPTPAPSPPTPVAPPPPRAVPASAARQPARPSPPVIEDEVVPGIGGGSIRPAAAPGAQPARAATSTGSAIPVKEAPASQLPVPEGLRPVKDGSPARAAPVQERANGKSPPAGSIPVPQRALNGKHAAKAPEAPVPDGTGEMPVIPDVPPAPPDGPGWFERNRMKVIVGASAVVGLVIAVVIVVAMTSGGGPVEATTVDPVQATTDPAGTGATATRDTGKIKITSQPSKCEFMVNGVKSDLVTPAMLVDIPVGEVPVRVLGKDGFQDKVVMVKVEKDARADLHVVLDKKP